MKDERIEAAINHIARRVFLIWFLLILVSLNYRSLILRQHIGDYWDIFAIFVIGALYGFIAFASKGVFDIGFKRRWLIIFIAAVIGILTSFLISDRMRSVVDVGALLIGALPAMGLVIGIAYVLNRRWKRKEGIEDES